MFTKRNDNFKNAPNNEESVQPNLDDFFELENSPGACSTDASSFKKKVELEVLQYLNDLSTEMVALDKINIQ